MLKIVSLANNNIDKRVELNLDMLQQNIKITYCIITKSVNQNYLQQNINVNKKDVFYIIGFDYLILYMHPIIVSVLSKQFLNDLLLNEDSLNEGEHNFFGYNL